MKKLIALFSVVAFAFATSVAFAGPIMNLVDTDDSIFTQLNNRTSALNVNHNAFTAINSVFTIGGSTGGNLIASGGDTGEDEAVEINTGDVTVIGSEQYDVNGLDVQKTGCDCVGDEDPVLNSTDGDDSIATQTNNEADVDTIDSQTYTEANLNTAAFVEAGANQVVSGDDTDAARINVGSANLQFDRVFVSDLVRVIRGN